MKKTVLALIMSLIIVCSLALSVYASNTVSYTIESATTSRGETVELKVTASNATDVGSIMFVDSCQWHLEPDNYRKKSAYG